jgi:hypothetical protein
VGSSVVFTNSRPGFTDAAFIKRNEPRAASTAEIADLVRRGYYVRTRSDVPLQTVLAKDTSMRDAALASGAQLVSTDFPQIGMSARYDGDFVAALPDGGPARCDPVNALPACRGDRLERGADARRRAAALDRVVIRATALRLRAGDGARRELDGLNRAPGLVRGRGGTGGDLPTELPKHDFTCTDRGEVIRFQPVFGTATESGPGVEGCSTPPAP